MVLVSALSALSLAPDDVVYAVVCSMCSSSNTLTDLFMKIVQKTCRCTPSFTCGICLGKNDIERVHNVNLDIKIEIATNKRIITEEFSSLGEFVTWWNEHESLHGQSPLLLTMTRMNGT